MSSARLERLPSTIKEGTLSVKQRVILLQERIDELLHKSGICPIAEHMAGTRARRIQVTYEHGHYWFSENFPNDVDVKSFTEALKRTS